MADMGNAWPEWGGDGSDGWSDDGGAGEPASLANGPLAVDRDALLRRMAESLDRLTRRLGREWGPLTHSQWAMLRRLLDGPVLVGALAERLDISTAGATRMLDKLELAGFVSRTRATDDLRQVAASLTPSGRQAVQEAFTVHVARLATLAEALPSTELAAWLVVLERMAPPKQCRRRRHEATPPLALKG